MDPLTALKAGFRDELTKIAGHVRAGRRPLKVATLLKKSALTKLSNGPVKLLSGNKKTLALLGAGAISYDQLNKAHKDWRNGRTMRLQQGY